MKRFLTAFFFTFLISLCFGQDINTLTKLNDACVRLGSNRKQPADKLQLEESLYKVNVKMAQHLELLLRAAEYYLSRGL